MIKKLIQCATVLVVIGSMISCGKAPESSEAADAPQPQHRESGPTEPETVTVGIMPKLVGIDFFNAAERGAREAAKELGVTLVFDGPIANDVQRQVQMLETWIAKRYDAIAVAPNDPDAISPVLEKAKRRGIKVLTWDADAQPQARDFFVNQCTTESVAKALMDVMAEGAGPDANYLILTGSLTAANQNIWMDEMEKYRQVKYPDMTNLSQTPKASEEDQALATQVTMDCLKSYPELEGIFAITSVALPGAAEALRKADAANDVFLTGLSTPASMREYVEDGTVRKFVLWSPVDLGYLAVHAAVAAVKGDLAPESGSFEAGRLGKCKIEGDTIILGDPIIFHKGNIAQYDF